MNDTIATNITVTSILARISDNLISDFFIIFVFDWFKLIGVGVFFINICNI